MLSPTFFFNQTIRRYTLAFGKIFSNVYVHRMDPYSTVYDTFKVPLHQASKKKFYLQLLQNTGPDNLKAISILLPRISFVLTNVAYDASRQRNQTNTYKKFDDTDVNKVLRLFEPVPYNFNYSMTVWTINEVDGHQIIEQILPYFSPFYTITVNEIPELGIKRDVPLELNTSNYDLNIDSGEDTNMRLVKWDFSFTMKGYLYKAIDPGNYAIIKRVIVKLLDYESIGDEDPYTYMTHSEEVEPWESLESDDWHILKKVTVEGVTTETIEEKP